MTLIPISERLAVEVSLPVFTTMSVMAGIRTPYLQLAGPTFYNPLRQHPGTRGRGGGLERMVCFLNFLTKNEYISIYTYILYT